MKLKYLKLESPAGVPTYRRPMVIPGFNLDNPEVFRDINRFMQDINGPDKDKLLSLMQASYRGLSDPKGMYKAFGEFRVYTFRNCNFAGIKYGEDIHYSIESGQGIMSYIGNSWSQFNLLRRVHYMKTDGTEMYSWQSIFDTEVTGLPVDVLEETELKISPEDDPSNLEVATNQVIELNKDYIFMYWPYLYNGINYNDNLINLNAPTKILPEAEGDYIGQEDQNIINMFTVNPTGGHDIKTVIMLGFKFYNSDGTTSHYEAEADKPYSTVYGEYPFVPQGLSYVKFNHKKPYTKVCATRRIKNGLKATASGYTRISYPFLAEYTEIRNGFAERKDILDDELVLGGNYPAGTSKDPYISYDLYNGLLPIDIENDPINGDNEYNIGCFPYSTDDINGWSYIGVLATEKTSITDNGEKTHADVKSKTFQPGMKCYDVHISGGYSGRGYIRPGTDGTPPMNGGGYCSGSGY